MAKVSFAMFHPDEDDANNAMSLSSPPFFIDQVKLLGNY
jgi:hypothetical protein